MRFLVDSWECADREDIGTYVMGPYDRLQQILTDARDVVTGPSRAWYFLPPVRWRLTISRPSRKAWMVASWPMDALPVTEQVELPLASAVTAMNHSPLFFVDEAALKLGTRAMLASALDYLR
jgi:hypothetical protein